MVAVASSPEVRGVVLDCESVPFVDVTAAEMVVRLGTLLAARGTRLVLARDIGQVRDVLGRVGDVDATTVYPSVSAAVEAVRAVPPGAKGRGE